MSSDECLKLICDGEIEIIKITEDLYDATIQLYRNSFLKNENVSIACELLESEQVIAEMELLLQTLFKDNISFGARDVKTKELVGMCVNKVMNPAANISLDEVFDSFQTENMKMVGNYLQCVECTYDITKEWHVDCVIDMTFLSTRSDYGRRGIALGLVEYLVEYATKLKEGSKKEVQALPEYIRDQRPQAIMSALTSYFSQRVCQKAKFEILFQVENSKFKFRGKTFAEKIDPIHKYSMFAAMKL